MALADKSVLVIGGGAAGLAAALDLANLDVSVEIAEQAAFLGGNAAGFVCKAADKCVKCGACMVEERLKAVAAHPGIRTIPGARIQSVSRPDRFEVEMEIRPAFIDPDRCTACGECLTVCPEEDAIIESLSGHNRPPLSLEPDNCRHFKEGDCTRCQETCPEDAIDLEKKPGTRRCAPDAIIMATGFTPFSPEGKPYGYGRFADVVTNLQLESMLRRSHLPNRPSDGRAPDKIAFVQCVGSRDSTLDHLWCSRVCCGSALRMAGLIQHRRPETEITVFYIDIQNFGRDFDTVYAGLKNTIQLKRAIPADILQTPDGALEVTYFDNETGKGVEEIFDMVILSVGLTPRKSTIELARALNLPLADSGFAVARFDSPADGPAGVFTAGSACGPMSIPESIADAGTAAWQAVRYLRKTE